MGVVIVGMVVFKVLVKFVFNCIGKYCIIVILGVGGVIYVCFIGFDGVIEMVMVGDCLSCGVDVLVVG